MVTFENGKREMVESRRIQPGHEDPHKVGLEAMLQAVNVEEAQLPDGSYVSTSTVSLPQLMGRMAQEIVTLRARADRAYTDSTTSAKSRLFFDEKLAEYVGMAQRSNERHGTPNRETVSVVFFDFNDFKHYNDTYGHPAADDKIAEIADRMGRHVRRSTDHICRYGGDEFALILWETDAREADLIADSIRRDVGQKTGVKMSYGVANYARDIPDVDYTRPLSEVVKDLVTVADRRMYMMKQAYKGLHQLAIAEAA